jgi:hypothetical protein
LGPSLEQGWEFIFSRKAIGRPESREPDSHVGSLTNRIGKTASKEFMALTVESHLLHLLTKNPQPANRTEGRTLMIYLVIACSRANQTG